MTDTVSSNSPRFQISPLEAAAIKHPFMLSALLCLFGTVLTFGSQEGITPQSIIIMAICGCMAAAYAFSSSKLSTIMGNHRFLAYPFFIFLSFILGITLANIKYKAVFLLGIGILICVYAFIHLCITKRLTSERLLILLFMFGFLLKFSYVLYTAYSSRQHDVSLFTSDSGHAAYITYLYKYMSLPDFDVRNLWQFYHPPLHHTLAALWLKLLTAFGVEYAQAFESIQMLTLFYSSCCMILAAKIFKALNLKGAGMIVASAIVAFHPTFIIFAGGINNDILSATFILGAILNTITWYKNPTANNILKIALCIGLGMMTKISAWMVAPAIALIFAVVFFTQLNKWKRYIGQFAAFLGVCAPLALWWPIRNYVSWGVPFTYIPMLSKTSEQYIGHHSVLERLFDFNWSQFEWVYTQFRFYEGTYYEYNPTIALFKTSLFGERINDVLFPALNSIGPVLFWSCVALAVVSIIAAVYFFIKKNSQNDVSIKLFIFLLSAVFLVSYYYFCITYPHTCTQNIRYTMPIIIIGAFFAGTIPSVLKKKNIVNKILRIGLYCLTAVFCAASTVTYFIVGYYSHEAF
ncbi:MAG: ArnT family glycosyltransferase [Acutalibacteraceae bacterium]